MDKIKLKKILRLHKLWLEKDSRGKQADLSGANLSHVDLSHTDLNGTNLSAANLHRANLSHTNLTDVNLSGADLSHANLSGANLTDAYLSSFIKIPSEVEKQFNNIPAGDVIGYKKLKNGIVCTLKIPAVAKRCRGTTGKCRAEFAEVLDGEGFSIHAGKFEYKIGKTVRPTEDFVDDWRIECTDGIHFFLTRCEAEEYEF